MSTETFFFSLHGRISAAKYNLNISPVFSRIKSVRKQLKFTDQPEEKVCKCYHVIHLIVSTNRKAGNRHGSEAN